MSNEINTNENFKKMQGKNKYQFENMIIDNGIKY